MTKPKLIDQVFQNPWHIAIYDLLQEVTQMMQSLGFFLDIFFLLWIRKVQASPDRATKAAPKAAFTLVQLINSGGME